MEQAMEQCCDDAQADFFQRSVERLRSEGFKITPQRTAILDLFHEVGDHLTPQEIYQRLEGHVASLSLATVYNTLEVFEKVGILSRVMAENGQTYFDPNPTRHHHGVCERCEALFDLQIDEDTMSQVMNLLQGSSGAPQRFRIRETKMWFRGLCTRCQ
jgi:Fur family transcriptional regulator, peroxide stress response regulator